MGELTDRFLRFLIGNPWGMGLNKKQFEKEMDINYRGRHIRQTPKGKTIIEGRKGNCEWKIAYPKGKKTSINDKEIEECIDEMSKML